MSVSRTRAHRHRPLRRAASRLALAVIGAALAGCVAAPPTPGPAASGPAPKAHTPRVDPEIALLVTGGSPAFAGVAEAIRRRHAQRTETYTLGPGAQLPAPARQKLQASSAPVVVAIGLPAARVAKETAGRKVIFCQVFNHEEAGLASPSVKGVSMMPPAREQLRAWKALSPGLKTVGLITGSRLRWLVDDAMAAAREHGIELIHLEVASDKETLYAYKRLGRRLQGLWLVPDNRVLSSAVLHDMMVHSVKEGIQVLAFSRELLGLGALLSAESRHGDIAEQVLARVRDIREASAVPGPDLRPLAQVELRINAVMARRLKLTVPKELAAMTYTPS